MYPEVTSVYVPVKTPDYRVWAILLSILGHGLLVGVILYFHNEAPPPPMETVLISPEELADIQGQIQANQQNNANQAGGMPTAQTAPTTNPETEKLMQQIAEQEAQFQANQAKIAEQIDQEFMQEQQAIVEQLDQEFAEKQAQLAEHKQAESNIDEIEANLRAQMEEAKRANQERIDSQRIKIESKDLSTNGERLPNAQSNSSNSNANNNAGNDTARRGAISGTNVASYRDSIVSKIYSNWNPPTNSNGKVLRVTIRLSPSGAVLSTNLNASDPFSKSLQEAINKSSPLPVPSDPEVFQKSFASLTLRFEGQ